MTFKKAIVLTAAVFALGACSITVDDDGYGYHRHSDNWDGGNVTATLDDGQTVSFGCPDNMKAFVVSENDGDKVIYGCRSGNVPVPTTGDGY